MDQRKGWYIGTGTRIWEGEKRRGVRGSSKDDGKVERGRLASLGNNFGDHIRGNYGMGEEEA